MDDSIDWFSEETATFGDRLAAGREAAGLSQKELAQKVGIQPATLRNWENDLSEPRANRLNMLAGLLGVSLSWLLTGEGEGVSLTAEGDEMSADISALLTELRSARAMITTTNDRLALIEKRLLEALNP